jgi:hypothetical protein
LYNNKITLKVNIKNMLLNRTEKDGVVSAHYDSSNILASKWNGKDLTVIFKHGASYTYNDVSKTDYTRFELAESQGVILNTKIKAYSFSKNDGVDADAVLKEIEDGKAEVLQKFEEGVVDQMRLISSAYEANPVLSKVSLEQLAGMLIKHSELAGTTTGLKLCACD